MARIRKRGKYWEYEIKRKGKVVHRASKFTLKKDAEKEAKEMEVLIDSNRDVKLQPGMTLVELFRMWLDVEILPQDLQVQTKNRYLKRLSILENYFEDEKISDIVRSDYQRFINWYGESYELNEVGRMNANINKAIEFAKADKILVEDRFLLNIKLNSTKAPRDEEVKFLKSRADYDRVIEYLELFMDYRHSVVEFIIFILFKMGFRPAEAICLTWENVDFENQEILTKNRWNSVQHKLSPAKNHHFYKKRNQYNPSVRKVPFDLSTKRVLLKLKKQQEVVCKIFGVNNEENYVFFQAGSKWPLPDESTVNKRVKNILKELGIDPIITAYGARHTYGSIKVQEGVPFEVLAKWFGHKDTTMLRTIYVHLLDETRDEWTEREKKLGGQNGGQT